MERDSFLPHPQAQQQNQYQQHGRYGSASDDGQDMQDPAYAALHHPHPQGQLFYQGSPSLTASQTLATAGSHGNLTASPGGYPQGHPGYYHYQQQQQHLYSPSAGYPSPGPSGSIVSAGGLEYPVADPYRSVYSTSASPLHHGSSRSLHSGAGARVSSNPYLPYGQHPEGSVVGYEDYAPSLDSRHSISSSGGGHNRYPMQVLSHQGSNQALTGAYYQQELQQHQHSQMTSNGSVVPLSAQRQSQQTSAESPKALEGRGGEDEEEGDENARILKRGVSQSGSRSAMTLSSTGGGGGGGEGAVGRSLGSRRKRTSNSQFSTSSSDESEEEGQEKGEGRRRDAKRCWCCSKRLCVYLTFVFMLCLGVTLFFVLPRSPGFSFISVSSTVAPVVSRDRIQEPFSLQIRVDSSDNYLPIRLNRVDMTMWLKIDQTKIGDNDGLTTSYVIQPKMVQVISVPMTIDYTSLKIDTNSDGALQELISACKPVEAGAPVRGINLTFGGKLDVWGLSWIWKPQFSFNVDRVPCPINARDPTIEAPPPPVSQPLPPASSATGTATGTGRATGMATATAASAAPTPAPSQGSASSA